MEPTTLGMKLFLDTADTNLIRKYHSTGLIDGVTTNPTLIRKSGRDPEEVYQEIKDIGIRDISMVVVGNGEEMLVEGRRLARKFGDVATIKVPCTRGGLAACKILSSEVIKVNVTLIFNAAQALLASKAGAKYVSPFVGRLDDNENNGLSVVDEIHKLYEVQKQYNTEILSASIRDVKSVVYSFLNGANIVTMPPAIFDKMYNHVLTDKGLDLFDADWKAVQANG